MPKYINDSRLGQNFKRNFTMKQDRVKLADFGISSVRGFLPNEDPLTVLPPTLDFLDDFGKNLPELIESKEILTKAQLLPIPPLEYLALLRPRELELVWMRYVFIQSAFVHSQTPNIKPIFICPSLARPVWAISRILNKPPILSYDAYTLNNWKRINKTGPIKVDNLELIQTFIRDSDQAWFILIHVDIEYEAGFGIRSLWDANLCIEYGMGGLLDHFLVKVSQSIKNMIATMKRMPEGTSPDTYHRIRPWIMPFKDVVYQGVDELGWKPQSFRGQTGAQTSIFQSLEPGLQIPKLSDDSLAIHLMDMRNYMPLRHRQFIEYLENNSKVRDFVISSAPHLIDIYDECVLNILTFLAIHLGYAFFYIHQKTTNPKGTGDTPDFMDYLGKRIGERWEKAFIKQRSDDDFKLFMNNVRKMVKELIAGDL